MRRWLAVPFAVALAVAPIRVGAQEAQQPRGGSFSVGFGAFNMGHANPSGGVGMEYHLDNHPWTSKDAWFGYAGLRADLNVTERWRLTPGFAIGAYDRNGDIDLGGPVEFRSSLDVSRALRSGVRLGVALYHVSNARLYQRNPGVNALAFVQTF